MATRKKESQSFGVKNIPFTVQLIIKQSVAGASLAYFSGKAMEPHHHDSFRPTFYQAQDWHHLCGQGLADSATVMAQVADELAFLVITSTVKTFFFFK